MKKLVVSFFVIFIFAVNLTAQTYSNYAGAAENKQKYSPIDKSRFKPLSQEEDIFRFTGVFHGLVAGGIKFVWLENELVVFNKTTKKNTRIFECGNKGEFFEFSSSTDNYPPERSSLAFQPEKREPCNDTPIISKDCDNCNDNIYKYSATVLGTGIGVLIGGFGFRTTEVTTDVVVIPGIRLQTGDGTIIFGPNKTNIIKSSKKKFNTGAAIGCGIASGLITYFLMEWLM